MVALLLTAAADASPVALGRRELANLSDVVVVAVPTEVECGPKPTRATWLHVDVTEVLKGAAAPTSIVVHVDGECRRRGETGLPAPLALGVPFLLFGDLRPDGRYVANGWDVDALFVRQEDTSGHPVAMPLGGQAPIATWDGNALTLVGEPAAQAMSWDALLALVRSDVEACGCKDAPPSPELLDVGQTLPR